MTERIRTSITLTPDTANKLEAIAKHQLRSRSHTIEGLIMEAYATMKDNRAQHKARKQPTK